jgi:DNA-binding FadR family transcriptional regulator
MNSIRRVRLADPAIEQISGWILRAKPMNGEKRPQQSGFAAQLDVSWPSLRKARDTLSVIGALKERPGFGMVIKPEPPLLMADHLRRTPGFRFARGPVS